MEVVTDFTLKENLFEVLFHFVDRESGEAIVPEK